MNMVCGKCLDCVARAFQGIHNIHNGNANENALQPMKIVNESDVRREQCAQCLDKTQTNDNCLGSTNPVNRFEEPKMSTEDFKVASPPTLPKILSIRRLSKPLRDRERESTAYDYNVY